MLADRRLETSYNTLASQLANLASLLTDTMKLNRPLTNVVSIKGCYNQVRTCKYSHSGGGKTSLAAN